MTSNQKARIELYFLNIGEHYESGVKGQGSWVKSWFFLPLDPWPIFIRTTFWLDFALCKAFFIQTDALSANELVKTFFSFFRPLPPFFYAICSFITFLRTFSEMTYGCSKFLWNFFEYPSFFLDRTILKDWLVLANV